MVSGACLYVLYLGQLLVLHQALLYAASALLGLGAALLWTAQVRPNFVNSILHECNFT
jgi:hypothetical protein